MNKKKLLTALLGLFIIPAAMQAQLLKGIVKADSIQDMQVTYYKDGNILDAQYKASWRQSSVVTTPSLVVSSTPIPKHTT